MLQFGDPLTKDMTKKDMWGTGGSGKPVGEDETKMAKHKFVRGTVGLGYRQDFSPKTADSYIVIIKGANSAMDGKYAVLGKVSDGMAVADRSSWLQSHPPMVLKPELGKLPAVAGVTGRE